MKKIVVIAMAMQFLSSVLYAGMYATLDTAGKIWTFSSSNVAGTTNKLATLTSGGTYRDVTFGNGMIYGLRSDGKVFASDLSGNVSEVTVSGWDSTYTKIDYANGILMGMGTVNAGAHYVVKDSSGTLRLQVYNRTAKDFAARASGNISVLQGTTKNNMITFTNSYVGTDAGAVNSLFFSSDAADAPLSLDIYNELAATLTAKSTTAEEWKYQNGLGQTVTTGQANMLDAQFLTLSADGTETVFLNPAYGGAVMRLFNESKTVIGTIDRGTAIGVGIVAIPEPATLGLFVISSIGLFGLRHLQR
jgi:hypothetical protein